MRSLRRLYMSLVYLFLYAPIIILIVYSFNNSRSRSVWGGFTFKWYIELFRDAPIMSALADTLAIALLAAAIATVMGTFAAVAISSMGRTMRGIVMNITYLPVLNADIVTGVSLMLLFIAVKIPMGFGTLLLAHLTFNVPYVILAVLPKLKQVQGSLYEAALDLGATPAYAFRKIILPEIMPGIINGALMAFTLSIDDFVISFFTTGSGVSNLSILIYGMAKRGVRPTINALSALMFISVMLLLMLINWRTQDDAKRR